MPRPKRLADPGTPGFIETLRRQYAPLSFLAGCFIRTTRRLVPGGRSAPPRPARLLAEVNAFEAELQPLTHPELSARFQSLRKAAGEGFGVMPEAFAITREAIRRTLGRRLYDVQILGGLAMARGEVAEMSTGEGKTLTVVPPAAFFALGGKGVHVATVNSYLAERDQEETAPTFELLGLTSALLPERCPPEQKRRAYLADITYGVGHEFGFDYLRDQTSLQSKPADRAGTAFFANITGARNPGPVLSQRPLHVALIDEADSIMIDEALTPLLLSASKGKADPAAALAYQFADLLASKLVEGEDFEIEQRARFIRLLPQLEERLLNHDAELDPARNGVQLNALRRAWPSYLRNALFARHLFERDVHYMINDGKVVMVDESTGRAFPDRTWKDGLHQAIEAKEELENTDEGVSMASISRQRFYRLYNTLAGMSGTVMESAGELWQSYRLPVTRIPLNRPSRLKILPLRFFRTREGKVRAVIEEIATESARRRPVLVGTRTIRQSEEISDLLTARGIPHRLLNARQDKEEADIIRAAGEPGAVTIATNMAGRGAHINIPEESLRAGGLHVIGLEPHESIRVDRQLLGRSARQGQPGSGRFYASLEDELVIKYGDADPVAAATLNTARNGSQEELPAAFSKAIRTLQRISEESLYRKRRLMLHQQEWQEQTRGRF